MTSPRVWAPGVALARVRWGNQRFRRVNEFASEEAALAFAAHLRQSHGVAISIDVDRRVGERWTRVGAT